MTRAIWHDTVIAESDDTIVVDGYTYFPISSVDRSLLVPSDHTSVCIWKGTARYYDIIVDGAVNRDAAWEYPNPSRAAAKVDSRISFWRGVTIERAPDERRPSIRGRLRRQPRPPRATKPNDEGSPVVNLDDETFANATAGTWTVVDFWAPWCGPCRAFHPVFDRYARDTPDLQFARVDVEANPNTATGRDILSIPTVVLFDPDGLEVERLVGVPSRSDLERLLAIAAEQRGELSRSERLLQT